MGASTFPSCPGVVWHGSCHASEGFYSWSLTPSGMSMKWQLLESSDSKAHWQVLHFSTCQQLPACWSMAVSREEKNPDEVWTLLF